MKELIVVACVVPALILITSTTPTVKTIDTEITCGEGGYCRRVRSHDDSQEMASSVFQDGNMTDYEEAPDDNYQVTAGYDYKEKLPSGFRQGRWGIFFTYEPVCTLACRKNGKFSGRMYGGVCRCYCPRLEQDPCTSNTYPSCDRFCRQNNYQLGGDCLDETNCYCYCTVRQRQSPNGTTTTAPPPCGPDAATSSTGPPPEQSTQSAPSPGTLGINQGGGTFKNRKQKRRQGPRVPRT